MIATAKLEDVAYRFYLDPTLFSEFVVGRKLRRYQLEPARAIVRSIDEAHGDAITVMMARQAGKNELSAQLEAFLLNVYCKDGGQIVKAAPTYSPQIGTSRLRLEWAMSNPLNQSVYRREPNAIRLGAARCQFLSAEPGANVVGATASILLEIDEAQDIDPAKYDRDFAPMASSTNATRVFYGTAWRDDDLLQTNKEHGRALERRDGRRRHFEYPWDVVAESNPDYARYVLGERARLGEDHPLFRTQYRLLPLGGEAGFLNAGQRELMRGDHARLHAPTDDATYVAGVDLAGPDEEPEDTLTRRVNPRRDSTVVTIARLTRSEVADGIVEPKLEVVEHYWWTGRGHQAQYEQLLATLRDVWRCRRIAVDASGIGAGVAHFLRGALGDVVQPFLFTAEAKSKLGFVLLAAVNGGRFRMYASGDDDDGSAAEFWREAALCRYSVRRSQQLAFWVPETEGHDDFVTSAALCAWAGREILHPPAAAIVRRPADYDDGRY